METVSRHQAAEYGREFAELRPATPARMVMEQTVQIGGESADCEDIVMSCGD